MKSLLPLDTQERVNISKFDQCINPFMFVPVKDFQFHTWCRWILRDLAFV